MTILDKIIQTKRKEVASMKDTHTLAMLEKSPYYGMPVPSMKEALKLADKVAIIAEIKRSSPSTGPFKESIDVGKLSSGYIDAGASALSVLTDKEYFRGSSDDLSEARIYNSCPILRKDFIIDEIQLHEAKSIGASCILLIAACLSPGETRSLAGIARSTGLEVLLEVHDREELESHLNPYIDIVGVNNRNLKDFTTTIDTSLDLVGAIPEEFVRISESGIEEASQIVLLQQAGFHGFLIGGHFMKKDEPAEACANLVREVRQIQGS